MRDVILRAKDVQDDEWDSIFLCLSGCLSDGSVVPDWETGWPRQCCNITENYCTYPEDPPFSSNTPRIHLQGAS